MKQKILCIDDDATILLALRTQLKGHFETVSAQSLREGLECLARDTFELILLDVSLGGESGIDGVKQIKQANPDIDIVMLSGEREPHFIVDAIRAGASDYLPKPFDLPQFLAVADLLTQNRSMRERYQALVEAQNANGHRREMIFSNPIMQRLLNQAEQLKGYPANVLIVGETGTGKELLARYIHRIEGNARRPFVAVNCAAIPEHLIEAELFGCERGAYTGSIQRRIGRFELADGGDIFLDEVGALKLDLQAKILRVLQEKEFSRVGGNATINASFRVIAATNNQLDQSVTSGEFRMDLYHRLRVIQLTIPPLRERPEDIPVLIEHFLAKHTQGKQRKKLSTDAFERLAAYGWPGNVRELENVIQSLLILTPGDVIEARHLPPWALNGLTGPVMEMTPTIAGGMVTIDHVGGTLRDYTLQVERTYIQRVLESTHGDKSKAARILNVGRTTLYAKLKELGMM
ncbi:MAG: sigma-54-dependent Fis family transcriptional regulator [Deltaproteobacteria bacterium]|nr:sigma-54-dependent Fis family transcriptional regulator [Deltaproteobacteria bacterium]